MEVCMCSAQRLAEITLDVYVLIDNPKHEHGVSAMQILQKQLKGILHIKHIQCQPRQDKVNVHLEFNNVVGPLCHV